MYDYITANFADSNDYLNLRINFTYLWNLTIFVSRFGKYNNVYDACV